MVQEGYAIVAVLVDIAAYSVQYCTVQRGRGPHNPTCCSMLDQCFHYWGPCLSPPFSFHANLKRRPSYRTHFVPFCSIVGTNVVALYCTGRYAFSLI